MNRLVAGQRAIVSGGGTGLGFATAKRLLEHGADVFICSRNEEVLEASAARLERFANGGAVTFGRCDVTDEEQVEEAMALAAGPSGRLDLMVAVVGGTFPTPMLALDVQGLRSALDLNVISTWLCIKHATPYMKEHGGSMVTMSSTAGIKVEQWMSAYSTSKAAVEMLTKCAAFELSPFKIRVNGIRPGWHATESNLQYCPPDFQEEVIGKTLIGRPGEPEEIGDAIVWLASPMASFVTGQILGIDGGLGVDMGENFETMVRAIHGDEVMNAALGKAAAGSDGEGS